jgi:hypothetical protein
MSGVSIQVTGLDELKKRFRGIPDAVTNGVDAEMQSVANEYVNKAVAMVPIDRGMIKNGITSTRLGEMNYEVVSGAPYSAYMEFGTKSKIRIPAGLTSYAAQFKGPGKGNLEDFHRALTGWVDRKGIAASWSNWGQFNRRTRKRTKVSKAFRIKENEEIARVIMIKILMKGVEARPFFFPHLPWAQSEVQKRANAVVKKALG